MLRWNRCRNAFAFILAPCPEESNPFESIHSRFLRRLMITNQWGVDRDEAIHREAIVQHLADLCNLPILGIRVIQHDHHAALILAGVLLAPT